MDNGNITELVEQVAEDAGVSVEDVRVVRSPYRVCPLGAHVDHQLGEVTGMALDRALFFAFVPSDDGKVCVRSHNFAESAEFQVEDVPSAPTGDWADYLRGAVWALRQSYPIDRGVQGIVMGDDNVGGLSSSAAVGVAYLMALEKANDIGATTDDNVELDRMIENEFIGLENGLLDQSTILRSREGKLMYLDCQSGQSELVPCGSEFPLRVVVLYSGLQKQLSDTDYNRRVAECERAARTLMKEASMSIPPDPKLRHIDREVYRQYRDTLPPKQRRRAKHFFSEQRRVRDGVRLWKTGDLEGFGELVTASGRSSVENYECGNTYLRSAYRVLAATPGVLGARFSGAGFRGCSIGLMREEPSENLDKDILSRYLERHPDMEGEAEVSFWRTADGAGFVSSDS